VSDIIEQNVGSGHLTDGIPLSQGGSAQQSFLTRVHKVAGEDGCWLWLPKALRFTFRGITMRARPAAYMLFVGPIPPGVSISRGCINRNCVNPYHALVGAPGSGRPAVTRLRAQGRTHILLLADERRRHRQEIWRVCHPDRTR